MTQCNCKNTDELRIVRGNAFAIRLTVSAIHIDGTPVENFVLGDAEALLNVMHLDAKTPKDFLVIGNDAIISFDGTQPLGWYGFEMTGEFNGKPWRWCVPQVFQVVETNAKANIPSWAMLTDETYAINGVMTITSGDIYQSDWDETDPQSPSYIKNKPTKLADFDQDPTHRVVSDEQIAAWNNKYDKPSGGIPASDLAGDIPESKLDQSTQEKIDAGNSAYQKPSGGIPSSDMSQAVQTSLGKADTAIQDVTQIETDIDNIEKLIPQQATEQNQLADKQFVNSSIATATATYRGAYNLVSDLSLTTAATEQQIAAALATKMAALSIEPDNNDYCFVQIPTADATPTQIARVDRYKYNGTAWAFEFSLNNSGFTAAQWAALNSGITSGLVTKLSDLPTNSELTTLLNGKQDTISDLSDIRSGAAAGATAYQKPSGGIPKSDLDSSVQTSLGKADTAIQDVTQIETDIDNIEKLIPQQATEQNQLADKQFVNSSISTATATYRGAYNLVSDLELTTAATEQQIAAALATVMAAATPPIVPDNNDYCFVQVPTADATPTEIARVDRYKYNGTAWAFEFSLNNSGFTAAQWAALNSGITSGLVTKLSDLPTNSELTILLNGKQDTISDLSDIRSGAAAGATAYQKPSGGIPSSDMSQAVQTSLGKADTAIQDVTQIETDIDNIEKLIPQQATEQNQLADKQFVNSSISTATATYRGAYNLVSDLELTTAATEQQIAAALATKMAALSIEPDNNDYCFVQIPTADAMPTQIARVDRYKYNGTAWAFEFSLNNSGFTAAQWAALNSGITSGLVTKLSDLPTNSELTTLLNGKQDTLTFDNTPTENSNNPVKSGGIYASQTVQDARIAALEKLHEDGADYIYIDETIEDPMTRVYGHVNGPVIQWIRKNSHRYLGKRTADGVMTVCQLDDANSNLYAEDGSAAVLTGAEGDVFMWLPEFYTETVEVGTKLWRIGFSKKSFGTGWHKWKNDNLVGVYEASVAADKEGNPGGSNDGNGIMRSVSGTASQGSVSQANFKTKARNKGTGYSLVLWRQHCIMAVLYYAEYGNTNCQGSIGSGTSNSNKVPGQTDALGMTDTVNGGNGSSGSINFWGLENWWGNKAEWIDNVEVNPLHDANDEPMIGVWRITEDDGTTTDVQGSTDPLAINVYAQNLVYGDNLHIIARGNQVAGTSLTNYCDSIYTGSAGSRVVRRSNSNSGAFGGVAYAFANFDSSSTGASFGSRLAFHGQIVKAESVAAFKAAPDYVGTIDSPAEENNE